MKNIYSFLIICLSATIIVAQTPDKNVVFKSNVNYITKYGSGSDLSNIGGYVDSVGNEYALVGWQKGLSIVDVTNPANPIFKKEITGVNSFWREVKVRGKFAYVTTEGGNGLQIINLGPLPNTTLTVKQFQPNVNGNDLNTIHALHIDGKYLYLYGSNLGGGGAYVFDLTNPMTPEYVGNYDDYYVHDGYVQNDTMYACHIYDGFFTIVDFTDKQNPKYLGERETPNKFTHNSWLSTGSQYLFTTDEVDDSYLTSYDISDPTNIKEVDRIQSQNPGSQSIVHNTHIVNDHWAVTSWYKDGIVITDVTRPNNLVNVGWYDTSPLSGGDFDGCWGVYPFLPSGNLVCSDISEGLFVLTPTYKRATYVEGVIKDGTCGGNLLGASISITNGSTTLNTTSDLNGTFATGTPEYGTYTITISKGGFQSIVMNDVSLAEGSVFFIDTTLVSTTSFTMNGNVYNSNVQSLANVSVILNNGSDQYNFTTDANGGFSRCGVSPGTYAVTAGKWGYRTYCASVLLDNTASTLDIVLEKGIYDDFSTDNGWTVTTTADAGDWNLGTPMEEIYQTGAIASPSEDVTDDCSDKAYITGNYGGSVGTDDVDNGYTILTSPIFDATQEANPHLIYSRFFFNGGGSGTPNDTMIIRINNGVKTVTVEKVHKNTAGMSTWVKKDFNLSSLIPITSTMKIIVKIEDYSQGHIIEGGFDGFFVGGLTGEKELLTSKKLSVYPNPASGKFSVDLSDNSKISQIDLINNVGQKVKTFKEENNLNVNDLAKGLYIVSVKTKDGSTFQSQLIVE